MFPHIKAVSNRSVTLTSKGGTDFISFAKGASFDNGTALKILQSLKFVQSTVHLVSTAL